MGYVVFCVHFHHHALLSVSYQLQALPQFQNLKPWFAEDGAHWLGEKLGDCGCDYQLVYYLRDGIVGMVAYSVGDRPARRLSALVSTDRGVVGHLAGTCCLSIFANQVTWSMVKDNHILADCYKPFSPMMDCLWALTRYLLLRQRLQWYLSLP